MQNQQGYPDLPDQHPQQGYQPQQQQNESHQQGFQPQYQGNQPQQQDQHQQQQQQGYQPQQQGYPPQQQNYPPQQQNYPPQQQGNLQQQYQNPQQNYPQQNYAQQGMNSQPMVVMGQPQTTVLVVQNAYPHTAYGCRYAAEIDCPHCHKIGSTRINYTIGGQTLIASCLLCLIFPPLGCIPCCMIDCQDKVHHCSSCNADVGRFEYSLC